MAAMVIGGLVACCEPGCTEVFANLRDWQEHMELDHSDPEEYGAGDACYAEGLRRER